MPRWVTPLVQGSAGGVVEGLFSKIVFYRHYAGRNLLGVMILTFSFFFFNDTATTEIYTLSLHDALPISSPPRRGSRRRRRGPCRPRCSPAGCRSPRRKCRARRCPSPGATARGWRRGPGCSAGGPRRPRRDRKSTRLNSSHSQISYAVLCL